MALDNPAADSAPTTAPKRIYLADYQPPAWWVRHTEIEFDLDLANTEVTARLHLEANEPSAPGPLVLDGEELELLSISVDGAVLEAARYQYEHATLTVTGLPARCVLETRVRIHPETNTQLEGLFVSRGLLITQCEAEGFRRITFFVDRPDVMSTWRITLRADAGRFPVLLANGNPLQAGTLDDGRHMAEWQNPHPTPCYLFAVVAGDLATVSKELVTAEGRKVKLAVLAAPSDIDRCDFALGALERALRWDEKRFGRCYDLDVYNLVAVQDFTMGAMENKGLNVFNARYVLADPETATDVDYQATEAVIGHEYFHNWSGNRVTLRDWFQLSLKEGFTVFRDQEFTSDLHSRAVKRIEDVRMLRMRQFAEDAGALAHPVRPDSYREINNFYTATVYEKGSEVVRMLHTLLGEETFRRGCDRYFKENDGRAATVEDFLAAMAAESGRGLEQFAGWYRQAGTPELRVTDQWDENGGVYEMTVVQQTPPTPGQAEKLPVAMPFKFALYAENGEAVTKTPQGGPPARHDAGTPGQILVELAAAETRLRFEGLPARPLPAFNQGFAAPVKLHYGYTPADLGRLARIERDSFNRWEAMQRLATGIMLGQFSDEGSAREALRDAFAHMLADHEADAAFVAECMHLPDFDTLADQTAVIDVDALLTARDALLDYLAGALTLAVERRYEALEKAAGGGFSGKPRAARALRNVCVDWLTRARPAGGHALAQYDGAINMTQRLGALRALVRYDAPGKGGALASFRDRFRDDALVTDKWLAVVATRPNADAFDDVRELLASAWWVPTNPNRVRAILGSFARMNPHGFHRADGAGYALLGEQLPILDKINSQVAARQLGAFESWARLDAKHRALAEKELRSLRGRLESRECLDLLDRLLPSRDNS